MSRETPANPRRSAPPPLKRGQKPTPDPAPFAKDDTLIQVELQKPHTHSGRAYPVGAVISVAPHVAQWLFDHRIIKVLPSSALQTPGGYAATPTNPRRSAPPPLGKGAGANIERNEA